VKKKEPFMYDTLLKLVHASVQEKLGELEGAGDVSIRRMINVVKGVQVW
jgi:hypothetical protein